jgi:hypothetical protein
MVPLPEGEGFEILPLSGARGEKPFSPREKGWDEGRCFGPEQ